MNTILKAAIVLAACTGLQAAGTMAASASQSGLLQYAQDPSAREVTQVNSIKVASRRSRRRNRALAAGIAIGVAAAVVAPHVVRSRRSRYSRYSYPGARTCRIWATRCDNGRRSQCRKWDRRCR